LSVAFAQQQSQPQQPAGQPAPQSLGVDTAQQKLKEVSITKFEDPGFWKAAVPSDQGLVTVRRFDGSPAAKTPLKDETDIGIKEPDKYVLGVKVEFYRRAAVDISVIPARPLGVEGVAKTVSVWVAGRNYNHQLKLMVEDMEGRDAVLTMGKLNFSGWKRLTVAIPPTLEQRSKHYNNRMGIKIKGFLIECDMMETYGSYFMYFDDLRTVTDLFAETNRDADDMLDTW
jgi:hypothetical protein